MRAQSVLRAAPCILAFVAVGLGAAGPQTQPQFRSAVDLVVVDVTVLNRGGDPVANLGPDDFALTVDGLPRRIQSVRLVRAEPPEGSGAPSLASTVAPSPRRFLVVIDREHIRLGEGQQMLDSATRFIDRLPPGDQVAVWTIPASSATLQFGDDREHVKDRIRRAVGTYDSRESGPWMVGRDEAIQVSQGDTGVLAHIVARECDRQPAGCPGQVRAQVSRVAMDARRRAETVLADLGNLIDALASVDGPKHLVLVTEGPVLTLDGHRTIAALGGRAALARVTVHALQVHDPSHVARAAEQFAGPELVDQGQSASFALAATTGGLASTPVSGDAGFARLARELTAGYLLAFEAEGTDRDGKVHQIEVKVRDASWGGTVRARKTFRIDASGRRSGRTDPEEGNPPPQPATEPPEPVGTEPGDMADRLADYVERFERDITATVAEERYVQIIHVSLRAPAGPDGESALAWREPGDKARDRASIIARRQLLSDVLMVQMAGQTWQSYRDVAVVDGREVRDRTDRVQRLFLSGGPDRRARFDQIASESARYNLGDLRRDLNLPTVCLSLLRRVNHPRFEFKRQKDETIGGRLCRVVSYKETTSPTLVSSRNAGDIPMYGRVWLDQADGRVRRTEQRFDRGGGAGRALIRVDFGPIEGLEILVPVRMWEWYEGVNQPGRQAGDPSVAQGLATYSNYRRFQVSTAESLK